MRYFADFVSAFAVGFAAAMAMKFRLPFTVWAWLAAQTFFTLGMWFASQWGSARLYRVLFHVLGVVLLLALGRSLAWPMSFWNLGLFPSLAFAIYFAGERLYVPLKAHYHSAVPQESVMQLVYGGIFLFCGFIAILALVEDLSPELRFAAYALGINWLAQGAFAWMLATNKGQLKVRGVDLNEFVPQFVAIVCCCWFGFQLLKGQAESARQHARDEVAMTELQHSGVRE